VTAMVALDKPFIAYLMECGGKDVLHFKNDERAAAAARTLRERHPEVVVEARYEKVFIRLKGSK
jgi:hypothetical protein